MTRWRWRTSLVVHMRPPLNIGNIMRIKRHDKSHIVELEDGTWWRIWPSDIATTLQWLPTSELQVSAIDHKFCSHVLIDQSNGSRVAVMKADTGWPAKQVQRYLEQG
jgi:hypothetical protein